MLKKLLSSSVQKQIVGVALTPGFGLEAVVYDRANNVVLNYGRKHVEYNFSTREIQDYLQFKGAFAELMDEMHIAPKTPVYIVLPNVYFDFIEVPQTLEAAEIKTALLSKAEEFYLFKKEEPVSGWCDVVNNSDSSQRRIAYSSFQQKTIDELKEIVGDMNTQLIGVESSFSATARGLYLTGQLDDLVLEHANWTIMFVNTNSYTLMNFEGKSLVDCSEVPIAIKSFSTEEAYGAVVSSSSQILGNFQSSKLFIVSQTDDICADVLKSQIQFDGEVVAIDSNKYSERPIVEVLQADDFSNANSMTLASLAASNFKSDFNLNLNVLADDPEASMGVYFTKNIFGMPIDVTRAFVMKAALALVVVFVIVFGSLIFLFNILKGQFENYASSASKEAQNLNNQINIESQEDSKVEIDLNAIIDEVAQMNVDALKFYDSLATDIPQNIWLTNYYNKEGNKIVVDGISDSIMSIYEYYKNLRAISPQSNIKLNELKVITNVDDSQQILKDLDINADTDRLYTFEIANISFDVNGIQTVQTEPGKSPFQDEDVIINSSFEVPAEQMKPAE